MTYSKTKVVKSPVRGTPASAGIDFFIPTNFETLELEPNKSVNIPSGIHVNLKPNTALIFFNKSGVAMKKELVVGACVVDEDYQGEIHLHVLNVGTKTQTLSGGDKLVQGILIPVIYDEPTEVDFDSLYNGEVTERGAGGFGSTGDK